ncbi:5-formyltetrahydrofolate cyclo-ligase [Pseudohalocynthiibacter aestuariivivens]|nr:5-formyltetrahydrofolate cyclo-ligase [Pseudohalocynthiibacter aestuariivivens]QIE47247.1 5-formyltetrahydrofolate cyclo-ligase [Pseudohalocynthiibacter aestuariivivens]
MHSEDRSDDDIPGDDPCYQHLIIAGHAIDPATARDVSRFRKAERARLYALRNAGTAEDRAQLSDAIAAELDRELTNLAGRIIAAYWPIRSEPDLRDWMTRAHEAGARIVLPVVVEKNAPLIFRTWAPRCAMERGIWNIPVPSDGAEATPDIVISPLLGVDEAGYRLGNGGGYYDRTLAAMETPPLIIGIGAPDCRIKTIYPMPWDVPMTMTVLGDGNTQHYPASA